MSGTSPPTRALIRSRWKALEDLEDSLVRVFDLESDPEDKNDLSSSISAPTAELLERLDCYSVKK
jgi:hypothetical protein